MRVRYSTSPRNWYFWVLRCASRGSGRPVRGVTLALFSTLSLAMVCASEPAVPVLEGFTEPYQQIELAAGEPGVLIDVRVREGTSVRQGELVGQLDTLILERTLEIARQRATSLGASQAADAERNLRRKHLAQLEQLHQRGHATQQELDRAETDLAIAEARFLMAKEELDLQRLECRRIEAQIERRQLRSPIDGVVSEVFREAGEAFLANDPRVLTIVQTNRLRAKFSAPPALAQRLKAGQTVQLVFPDTRGSSEAKVESISPVMDAKSGTVSITVEVENAEERIPSGARCVLHLPTESRQDSTQTQFTTKKRGGQPAVTPATTK